MVSHDVIFHGGVDPYAWEHHDVEWGFDVAPALVYPGEVLMVRDVICRVRDSFLLVTLINYFHSGVIPTYEPVLK